MCPRKALSKLQAILIIDIIVVAAAASGYFYVETLPKPVATPVPLSPAQIQLSVLQVNPSSALVGELITASINVTNTGEQTGTFPINLLLDGVQDQTQGVTLLAGETKVVEFTITGANEGTHIVGIGDLQGSFTLNNPLEFSDLAINRTTAQIDEPIGITVKVTNAAQESVSYSLTLSINDETVQTKTGQVNGQSSTNVLFEVSEQTEGTYQVQVAGLSGSFQINPSAPPPKPAEFQVSDLTVDPAVAQQGAPVTVTVKVTNVGEVGGSYTVDCFSNDVVKGSQTLQLSGGETGTVTFTITEYSTGTYTVKIDDLTGNFIVQEPGRIDVTNLAISPPEVWGGQTVRVTAKATNAGTSVNSLEVKLKVDNTVVETQTIRLAPGTFLNLAYTITAPALKGGDMSTHNVDLNGLKGTYKVVKDGYHTLFVDIEPRGDADFTLTLPSGATQTKTTPYTALLPVGTYTVTMPLTDPTGKVTFEHWEDRSTNLKKTASLQNAVTLIAVYSGGSSCPSMYMWNGTGYVYVSDVSNHGWLGYTKYVNADGSLEYWRNNPWDYIKLDSSQLQAVDGAFDLKLIQKWNEIFFMDSAYMLVVDHPVEQDVYSTMVEEYLNPDNMGKIYTVSKDSITPVAATNEMINIYNGDVVSSSGEVDALSQIEKIDGVFTSGFNGKYSEAWNNQTWNRLTVDLGDLSDAPQIKLVVKSIVDWGPAESYTLWMDKFYSTQVPDKTEPTPTPFMEVKDANGNWIRVPESRQFPLPPDGVARTFVVDMTGLFPTNDYSVRINTFWNVTFDFVGADTTVQQNTSIQRIDGEATLYQEASPMDANSSGNFTRYGDVTELLLTEDNMFVIGRKGDAVKVQFSTANLTAPAEGMERDYFFFVACWFKVEYANYGFGPEHSGFTVVPLPFHNMTGFPYPLETESYPYDAAHISYLKEYNTRVIAPVQQSTQP
ncbi:MAG: hypothetical protein NWF05_11705 [Candidatus Bathyarchaeota archaeon]|nr:hypothetical protein [Candidatus Bathyarchaeota archaeon]